MNREQPQTGTGSVTAIAALLLAATLAIGAASVVAAGGALARANEQPDPVAETLAVAAEIGRALAADPTPDATSRFDPVFLTAGRLAGVTVGHEAGVGAHESATPVALNVNLAPAEMLRSAARLPGMAGTAGSSRDAVGRTIDGFLDERSRREIFPHELTAAWGRLAERGVVSRQAVAELDRRFGTTSAYLRVLIDRDYSADVVFRTTHGSIAPVRIAIRTRSAIDSAPSFSMMEAR